MLNTRTEKTDGVLTVTLEGALDALTAPDFEKELISELEDAQELVLDVEKLDYILSGLNPRNSSLR